MAYGVAIALDTGLIFCCDSRTPEGVDRTGHYGRMFHHGLVGQRQLMVIPAGRSAITQAVVARLKADIKQHHSPNLAEIDDFYDAAHHLAEVVQEAQQKHPRSRSSDDATEFIIGGQIGTSPPDIARVDALGNYTAAPPERPFLQVGAAHYGQALLERLVKPDMPMENAARGVLLAMESAMRSSSEVGPPLDLMTYFHDSFNIQHFHFDQDDPYLKALGESWDQHLSKAFASLPALSWQKQVHDVQD